MAALCAACLLAARLASAPDAAPVPTSEAPAPTSEAPAPADASTAAPSPTRLALRDPFKLPPRAVEYRAPHSPDLLDPFTRPPTSAPARARDLRDPFVEGAPRRCLPSLRGVPVQRPRQLPQSSVPCTIETPLVNPFTPRAPASTG